MEVRCGSCNKLFRVSDDKISGTGIKFKCTRCGKYIKITREEFEQYRLSKETPPVFHMPGPARAPVPTETGTGGVKPGPAADLSVFKPRSAQEIEHANVREPLLSAVSSAAGAEQAEARRPSRSVPQPAALVAHGSPGQETSGDVHPLASGAAAGILGGLGCALPVLAFMILGFGIVARFVPFLSQMPIYIIAAASAAGLTGIGIIISMFLALVQARAGKKLFFMLNILLGTFFGAVLGALYSIILALWSGSAIRPIQIGMSALSWSIAAFLLSVSIVIMRRIMLSSKQESFGARLSGAQVFVVILSVSIIGLSVYGEVLVTSRIKSAAEAAAGKVKDMTSTEGLQIVEPAGYRNPDGDLVITGNVQNATDKERVVWYLEADVYDAQGAVLVQAGMMNGKQLYIQRDYDVLAKRGVNVDEFKVKNLQETGTTIAPHGTAHFEFRILEPPAGTSSFLVTVRQVDPVKMMQDMASAAKEKQQR